MTWLFDYFLKKDLTLDFDFWLVLWENDWLWQFLSGNIIDTAIYSKPQEESLNSPQLANIDERDVTEDLNINTILAKTLSIQFEEHRYDFTGQDFIDIFESNKSEMKAGGFAKVFQISKKSSGSMPNITSSFIIKTFDNFLISESPGCNNSLEIKFLEDLSKKFPGMSPYHVV